MFPAKRKRYLHTKGVYNHNNVDDYLTKTMTAAFSLYKTFIASLLNLIHETGRFPEVRNSAINSNRTPLRQEIATTRPQISQWAREVEFPVISPFILSRLW